MKFKINLKRKNNMAKKVLIVDDSALVRKQLSDILSSEGYELEFARNGMDAVRKCKEVQYDAVTLDINMPVLSGIDALKLIMENRPVAVVMVSSLTTEDAEITFEALDLGAIDFVPKPGTFYVDKAKMGDEIRSKVRVAVSTKPNKVALHRKAIDVKVTLDKKIEKRSAPTLDGDFGYKKVVLIGVSTGGPGLIESIARDLPADYPHPVVVVQHMPENFTRPFANRLDRLSSLIVKESTNAEELKPGHMYIAKGGVHTHFIKRSSGKVTFKHTANVMGRFFTPSVDEMMLSAADKLINSDIEFCAIILTGIGDDGTEGIKKLKTKAPDTFTMAESEESCVVFGMPKQAIESGAIDKVLDFTKIKKQILNLD
jgi:two-component system chemotaxis response regulator CheB